MRVNIIGCASRAWESIPWGEDIGEFWGVNDLHLSHDVDVVVDCHNMKRVIRGQEVIRRSGKVMKRCLKKIKNNGLLCYSTKSIKGFPTIKPYPLQEIIKEFDSDYFASGPDFAVALAIYKGFTEIHIYGILMVLTEEYAYQKPSFEHWLGVAKGRGIKTVIHDYNGMSSILKTSDGIIYGFNQHQRWIKWLIDHPGEFLKEYS